jgi:hypothetical protein
VNESTAKDIGYNRYSGKAVSFADKTVKNDFGVRSLVLPCRFGEALLQNFF